MHGSKRIRLLIDSPQSPYADFYERITGFGFGKAQRGKLFGGAVDGVVEIRVVVLKPLLNVAMPVVIQVFKRPGPVEASAPVVALRGIGQVQRSGNQPVGERDLGRFGRGRMGASCG